MKFHFQLKPIESISAWDDNPPTLHWYGLTDGWFWIEVGGQELFRYSDAVIQYWHQQHGTPIPPLPYEEYQVARYFEDLLQMLYAVLDLIPDDLAALVTNIERWEQLQKNARQMQESSNGDDDTEWGMYYTAIGWWSERQWSASHLNYPPRIWLWRHQDSLRLRWDNRNVRVEDIPV